MKVLITADIHIDDFPNYNYEYRSRLNQFDKLSDRIIELGKSNNCEEIWILGDLINKPNSRPYILHKASKFINKLCSNFTKVRYILGNHDVDSKSKDLTVYDSQITIFDHDNLEYMDKKILTINGHSYGFMNWRPNQDLTWLEDKHLDVLFGHYTKSDLFGQEIDESKFDLMIHGDIHNSQVIGKFVSVCNPIQHDMSSEKEGKLLIFDCDTMKWERILTDPDHTRFLQISYTEDQAEEGFRGPLQYNIFRPEIKLDDITETKSFSWNDIDELIQTSCKTEGLEQIHSEIVSKCDPFEEVDFNFQLVSLKIHGYRSIEDLDITFNHGDRIALLGSNGSGKSSIIRALHAVFLKNAELFYEQSDFTDTVVVDLKLVYQNKLFEIKKGSEWGLFIDGAEQSYHGIRDFETDLYVKLPFLNYLDLFFINSTVSNLASQFTPTRRIELISKFYRLDRINSYNSTSNRLWSEVNTELVDLNNQLNIKCGIRDHMVSRLTELDSYKDKDINEFKKLLEHYKEIRSKQEQWKLWERSYNDAKDQETKELGQIQILESKLSFDHAQGEIDLKDLKKKLEDINSAYEITYEKSIKFETLMRNLNSIEKEGKELNEKISSIKSGRCPECNAPLENGKSNELLESYQNSINKLREEWVKLDEELSTHKEGRNSKEYYFNTLTELKKCHTQTKQSIELLENKLVNSTKALAQLTAAKSKLKDIQSRLTELTESRVEKPEIPLDLNDLEFKVSSDITKCEDYKTQKLDLDKLNNEIKELEDKISVTHAKLDSYAKYSDLTSTSGLIYEEILKKLAVKFTTTDVKYEVESGVYRGNRFIHFNSYFLSKGTYRVYESCSDGQRTVCDLDFLEKLFNVNIGLLTLDEYLKHLDDINFPKICDTLSRMNVNTIILSTHDDNLTVYTRRLLLSLDNDGKTVMNVG